MKRDISLVAAILIVLATITLWPSYASEKITKVTICSLTSQPEKFNGKLVRIRAYAISDLHSTMLYGVDSEQKGIALVIPEEKLKSPEVAKLFERSFGPEAATGKRRVWATFTGTVEWKKEELPNLRLSLEEISDLSIEEKL